jgi:hypothetical protein
MKTLQDIALATDACGAKAVISMMRGSPKLKGFFLISAFSGRHERRIGSCYDRPQLHGDDASLLPGRSGRS